MNIFVENENVPGRTSEPGTVYCGVDPAALFASRDVGQTWEFCNKGTRADFLPAIYSVSAAVL